MKLTNKDIIKSIFVDETGAKRQVIWNIRLPRTIVACLVGMNLALSGTILQGVMGNLLADPQIIGISSGAGLAGILILVVFPEAIHLMAPFFLHLLRKAD
jgi:iron complex transport system permease protein